MSSNPQKAFSLHDALPHPPRVVVADDDWLNRDLLETYLGEAGCEVTACADGQAAWEAIESNPPDLALLDIQMPKLDGLALCRKIKEAEHLGYVPVIIVTALNAEDQELKAIEAGADDFINKPYSSVVLLTKVRSLLRVRRLHQELRERSQLLRQVLNRYVDEEIADLILTDPERQLKLGGEKREVVVLFADLRGFSRFTVAHPAQRVVQTLNRIYSELTQVIFKHGGTFDKYLGDAIMAFFGAPMCEADDACRALRAALEMQAGFAKLRKKSKLVASLDGLGVGVHCGEAIVGNIGSERVMDYTVIGDTVNVARRLQKLAQPGEVLISDTVKARAPEAVVTRQTDHELPGRKKPLVVYAVEGLGES